MHYFEFAAHIKKELSSTNSHLFNNYKLYKPQHCWSKQNSTNTKESSLPFENQIKTNTQVSLLQNINTPKYKTKLQMPYLIANFFLLDIG